MPPARRPTASIFCAWRNCSSSCLRSVMSSAMQIAPCTSPSALRSGFHVAGERAAFPFDVKCGRLTRQRAAVRRDRHERNVGCVEIFKQRGADHLVRTQAERGKPRAHARSKPEILVDRSTALRAIARRAPACALRFRESSLRRVCARWRVRSGRPPTREIRGRAVVSVFIFVVLHHEHADRRCGGAQRHAQPRRRGRAHEFHFLHPRRVGRRPSVG